MHFIRVLHSQAAADADADEMANAHVKTLKVEDRCRNNCCFCVLFDDCVMQMQNFCFHCCCSAGCCYCVRSLEALTEVRAEGSASVCVPFRKRKQSLRLPSDNILSSRPRIRKPVEELSAWRRLRPGMVAAIRYIENGERLSRKRPKQTWQQNLEKT